MPSIRKRHRNELNAEINVVPYIDVMLVLLVIFMITTPLLTQGVQVELPQASAKAIDNEEQIPIVVSVDPQGRYYLNIAANPTQPISAVILLNRMAAEMTLQQQTGRKRPVYVKGDRRARYEQVVQAFALLQQAGFSQVGLLTQTPAQSHAEVRA